jgi:hypothetical protein
MALSNPPQARTHNAADPLICPPPARPAGAPPSVQYRTVLSGVRAQPSQWCPPRHRALEPQTAPAAGGNTRPCRDWVRGVTEGPISGLRLPTVSPSAPRFVVRAGWLARVSVAEGSGFTYHGREQIHTSRTGADSHITGGSRFTHHGREQIPVHMASCPLRLPVRAEAISGMGLTKLSRDGCWGMRILGMSRQSHPTLCIVLRLMEI